MEKQTLKASKRTITGKKVKALRGQGLLPANVYGKKMPSVALQVSAKEFLTLYGKVGETGLVDLVVDGQSRPVLVANLQTHPVTDMPLHVDFRQVDLKEKIQAPVPVELIGESPAEKSGAGILVQHLNEIEVEALPADLPEKLVADVAHLEKVDDAVVVGDLTLDRSKVTLLIDQQQIVAKVEPLAKEEEVAPPPGQEGAEVPAPEGGEETVAADEVPPAGQAPAGEEGESAKSPPEK